MTFNELYQIWSKNINSEYILPTLDELYSDNIIISKENDTNEIIRQLKYYTNIFERKIKQEKGNKCL